MNLTDTTNPYRTPVDSALEAPFGEIVSGQVLPLSQVLAGLLIPPPLIGGLSTVMLLASFNFREIGLPPVELIGTMALFYSVAAFGLTLFAIPFVVFINRQGALRARQAFSVIFAVFMTVVLLIAAYELSATVGGSDHRIGNFRSGTGEVPTILWVFGIPASLASGAYAAWIRNLVQNAS